MDHLAGDKPGRAQQLGRLHHLAGGERLAHRAGGDRPALVFQRRHDVDGKAELGALLGEIVGRAAAVLAEMEVEADGRAADAEAADQDLLDEAVGRGAGEPGVEGHDDGAVEPGGGEQAQLVALARKLEQRLLRPEEAARMRRKGQGRRLASERAGARARRLDHRAVAAVHAVEIADRHHRAGERAGIDGAGLRRARRGRALKRALSRAGPLSGGAGARMVIARLTNFQINRLFNERCYGPGFRGPLSRDD